MAVKLRERRPGEWWLYVDHKGKRFAKKLGHDKRQATTIKREVERRLAAGDLGLRRGEVDYLDSPATIRNPDATSALQAVASETETACNPLESQAV